MAARRRTRLPPTLAPFFILLQRRGGLPQSFTIISWSATTCNLPTRGGMQARCTTSTIKIGLERTTAGWTPRLFGSSCSSPSEWNLPLLWAPDVAIATCCRRTPSPAPPPASLRPCSRPRPLPPPPPPTRSFATLLNNSDISDAERAAVLSGAPLDANNQSTARVYYSLSQPTDRDGRALPGLWLYTYHLYYRLACCVPPGGQ